MSWDGYIDSLCGGGIISQATIIGLNGAIWTPAGSKANILNVSQEEASSIAQVMCAKSNDKVNQSFGANGVKLGGEKYRFLRDMDMDGRIVTCKSAGKGNVTIQSTNQACIIAFVPDDKSSSFGKSNQTVDSIAKYLEGSGY